MELTGHPADNEAVLADFGEHPELPIAQTAQIAELAMVFRHRAERTRGRHSTRIDCTSAPLCWMFGSFAAVTGAWVLVRKVTGDILVWTTATATSGRSAGLDVPDSPGLCWVGGLHGEDLRAVLDFLGGAGPALTIDLALGVKRPVARCGRAP